MRRLTQIAFTLFILLAPAFDIFRYDSATKELFLFGKVWTLGITREIVMEQSLKTATDVAAIFFLKAILPWLAVLAFFPLMGFLFGRFFCGWLCPEGALFEFADFLTLKVLGRRSLYAKADNDPSVDKSRRWIYLIFGMLFFAVIPPVVAIALSGYFIAPSTIWHQITTGNLSTGVKAAIIGVTIYMLTTSLFVRHVFCKYVCAAGLMQMLFGWISPFSLKVRFKKEEFSRCTDCRKCERACFMGVKPRAVKRDINCVNCGECISACERELGKGRGLFRFDFARDQKKHTALQPEKRWE